VERLIIDRVGLPTISVTSLLITSKVNTASYPIIILAFAINMLIIYKAYYMLDIALNRTLHYKHYLTIDGYVFARTT